MPISPHLLRKLQETLGAEAAEDLVNWIEGSESLRGDVAELRHEMQLGFSRIDARFDQLRSDLEKVIEKRTADLMKWSFLFWVGAVGAIAALAGVLR